MVIPGDDVILPFIIILANIAKFITLEVMYFLILSYG